MIFVISNIKLYKTVHKNCTHTPFFTSFSPASQPPRSKPFTPLPAAPSQLWSGVINHYRFDSYWRWSWCSGWLSFLQPPRSLLASHPAPSLTTFTRHSPRSPTSQPSRSLPNIHPVPNQPTTPLPTSQPATQRNRQ